VVGVDRFGRRVLAHDRGGHRLVGGDLVHAGASGASGAERIDVASVGGSRTRLRRQHRLFFTAINKTSIAHAEFIAALTPLVLLPAGAFFFGERPNWTALRWGLISIVGVSLVLFFGPAQGVSSLSGDLLMIGVISLWTVYLLTSKRARAAGVNTLDFMACMMPIGVLTAGPIAAVIAGSDMFGLSAKGWLVVAILTLLTGMLSHGCIVFAQQHIPVATIGIMQTAQPALAVFFAFLILGEEVRLPQVLGMALVITGLALFTLTSARSASLPRPVTPVEAV
jgi:drug/metabolite transporter (DMT)-like permease